MSDGFACDCGPADKQRMHDLWDWIEANASPRSRYEDPEEALEMLTRDLSALYQASYTVDNDPGGWSQVTVYTGPTSLAKGKKLSIECDRILDGLGLAFQKYAEEFGTVLPDD